MCSTRLMFNDMKLPLELMCDLRVIHLQGLSAHETTLIFCEACFEIKQIMNTKSLGKQLIIQKCWLKTILTYLKGCASFTILVPTNMK